MQGTKKKNHSDWLILRMSKNMPAYSLESEPWYSRVMRWVLYHSLFPTPNHIGSAIHCVYVNMDAHSHLASKEVKLPLC
jgi:hypothetical protein